MAILDATLSFDQRNFSLNHLYNTTTDVILYNDENFNFNGMFVEDVLGVFSYDGEYWNTEFLGTGIVQDVFGNVIGGTVNGVVEYFFDGIDYIETTQFIGLSIDAMTLFDAALTASAVDDANILRAALSESDSFYLSDYADYADGYAGNDEIYGYGGADALFGGLGDDYIDGGADNDPLDGGVGSDTLWGNLGDDSLNGGGGTDYLAGESGNDTYVTDGGDTISEAVGQGADTVRSSVSYALGANLENLVLTGSSLINGTGNTLNNVITGNGAANTLNGGIGNDTLNGGTGNDRLVGGVGNDIYVINGGDTIVEAAAEGTDTVQSTVAYTLGLNLENLTLTGSGVINGTGNTLNNVITGNGAANTLNGGIGNDRITGGLGKDTLVGGVGADTFVFNKISDSTTAATTWDIITDFTKGQDKIDLRSIDAFGPSTANDAFLWKGSTAFSSATAGEARFQKYDNAGTANDYTVVFLDNDADTAVEMAIRLNGLHNLAATDFLL